MMRDIIMLSNYDANRVSGINQMKLKRYLRRRVLEIVRYRAGDRPQLQYCRI